MRFWDASAVVPLLVAESSTADLQALLAKDGVMLVWWATPVECASALARLERESALEETSATAAFDRLRQLTGSWHEVDAGDAVRDTAIRFLRVHPLRAADAMQLAAAFIAANRQPATLDLVTLDERVAAAARKEGFNVVTV